MPTHVCVCRNAECESAGVEVPMLLAFSDPETGESRMADSVICGACGVTITDVTPIGGS